jgi:hypothetical protein
MPAPLSRKPRLSHKGTTARRGPNLGPVLDNLLQTYQTLGHQRANALRQKAVQYARVLAPEIRQAMVVHGNASAQPAERHIPRARPVNCPRRAHVLQRCEKPNRKKNLRVRRRSARAVLARPNGSLKRPEVQDLNKRPNYPNPMFHRQLALKINHVPEKLTPGPRKADTGPLPNIAH